MAVSLEVIEASGRAAGGGEKGRPQQRGNPRRRGVREFEIIIHGVCIHPPPPVFPMPDPPATVYSLPRSPLLRRLTGGRKGWRSGCGRWPALSRADSRKMSDRPPPWNNAKASRISHALAPSAVEAAAHGQQTNPFLCCRQDRKLPCSIRISGC